jgi:hypothetical protein
MEAVEKDAVAVAPSLAADGPIASVVVQRLLGAVGQKASDGKIQLSRKPVLGSGPAGKSLKFKQLNRRYRSRLMVECETL